MKKKALGQNVPQLVPTVTNVFKKALEGQKFHMLSIVFSCEFPVQASFI